MRVDVVVLNDSFDLGLSAVLEVFQTANELIQASALETAPFEVRTVGVRREVRTARGSPMSLDPLEDAVGEYVVVPAIAFKMPAPLESALGRAEVQDTAAALHQRADAGATVAAACIGTFIVAESGLLDQQRATTTWWLAPLFRARYQHVQLQDGTMLVRSGNVLTAGAALAHVDLALALVREKSPELAALTARYLIIDSRPSQSAYALSDHLAHADPVVQRFERWARERLDSGFSLDDAAKAAFASKRTLARRVQSVVGKSPLEYYQQLRVERAVHLLRTTELSADQIASRVGYSDGATLRALLKRTLGLGIRQIRSS